MSATFWYTNDVEFRAPGHERLDKTTLSVALEFVRYIVQKIPRTRLVLARFASAYVNTRLYHNIKRDYLISLDIRITLVMLVMSSMP